MQNGQQSAAITRRLRRASSDEASIPSDRNARSAARRAGPSARPAGILTGQQFCGVAENISECLSQCAEQLLKRHGAVWQRQIEPINQLREIGGAEVKRVAR